MREPIIDCQGRISSFLEDTKAGLTGGVIACRKSFAACQTQAKHATPQKDKQSKNIIQLYQKNPTKSNKRNRPKQTMPQNKTSKNTKIPGSSPRIFPFSSSTSQRPFTEKAALPEEVQELLSRLCLGSFFFKKEELDRFIQSSFPCFAFLMCFFFF